MSATALAKKAAPPKRDYPDPTHFIVRNGTSRRIAEALCTVPHLIKLSNQGWPAGHRVRARYIDGQGETVDIENTQVLLILDLETALKICN